MTFLLALSIIAINEPILFHRKRVDQAEAKVWETIQSEPQKLWRILDFNFSSFESVNIISDFSANSYAEMSDNLRHKIFLKFADRILRIGNSGGIIHIDHHYENKAFDFVSTTVLVVDFMRYLDSETALEDFHEFQVATIKSLMKTSQSVMDHSDADILLSNYVFSNAEDFESSSLVGDILKSAALYHDYLTDISLSGLPKELSKVLFYLCSGLENSIQDEELSVAKALVHIHEAVLFFKSVLVTKQPVNLSALNQQSQQEASWLKYFRSGFANSLQKQKTLSDLVGNKNPIQVKKMEELEPGGIYFIGSTLILFSTENQVGIDSFEAVDFLRRNRREIAEAFDSVLIMQKNASGAWYLKVRALKTGFDFNLFKADLRKSGFDPGGRAQAAETAYGKSGKKDLSLEEMQRDIWTVARIFNEATCVEEISRLKSTRP